MHSVRSSWWKSSFSKGISGWDLRFSVSSGQLRWPKICGHTYFRVERNLNKWLFSSIPLRDIQRGKNDRAVVLLSLFHAGRSKGDCIVIQSVHLRFLERAFSIREELLGALRGYTEASPHSAGPPWIDSVKLSITFMFPKVQCRWGTGRGALHFYWMSYTFFPVCAPTQMQENCSYCMYAHHFKRKVMAQKKIRLVPGCAGSVWQLGHGKWLRVLFEWAGVLRDLVRGYLGCVYEGALDWE